MYKIKYKATGHIFVLPDGTAKELKENFPEDYQILEKNGKAFRDKKNYKNIASNSILEKIKDKSVEENKYENS